MTTPLALRDFREYAVEVPSPGTVQLESTRRLGRMLRDMAVLNRVSRFDLVIDALNDVRRTPPGAEELRAWCLAELAEHHAHVREHREDLPEIRDRRVGR